MHYLLDLLGINKISILVLPEAEKHNSFFSVVVDLIYFVYLQRQALRNNSFFLSAKDFNFSESKIVITESFQLGFSFWSIFSFS